MERGLRKMAGVLSVAKIDLRYIYIIQCISSDIHDSHDRCQRNGTDINAMNSFL